MSKLEICLWIMAAWCTFFGFRSTLALSRMWGKFREFHWIAPTAVIAVALMQLAGLMFFISSAMWAHTLRSVA